MIYPPPEPDLVKLLQVVLGPVQQVLGAFTGEFVDTRVRDL